MLLLGAVTTALMACAQPVKFPAPLRGPTPDAPVQDVLLEQSSGRARPRIEETTRVPPPAPTETPAEAPVPPIAVTQPIKLALDGVPLTSFINVVFGTELGFALEIDQAVRSRADVVSLRLTEPHKPEDLYRIGAEVLRNYGIRVVPSGGVLRFTPIVSASATSSLVITRSSPDVPAGQRAAFVAVPLDASEPGRVAGQIRTMLNGQPVTVTELLDANAVLLSGPGDAVQAAVEAAVALDRASLRDKQSLRINPLYLPADLLAKELKDVLNAEGYSVRTGPGTTGVLTFVPVASANALIVFSESPAALKAAQDWAEKLDQPTDQPGGGGVYMYAARHTTVETMLPVLEAMVGGAATASGARPATAQTAASDVGSRGGGSEPAGTVPRSATISGPGGQLALDPVRNVIVFQGDAQRWRAIQGVLTRLDTPARQVVIEVTVAEVTLTDEFTHGVEWALRNINFEGMSGPISALGGGSAPAGSLIWRALSGSGQTRAVLNLLAKDSRVSILSTPRLMVKSGESASIDVGTEVPIITQQATAPDLDFGNRPSILQSVQYRKTGVLLDLTAVVHSGQRVDLKLVQEVSEAQQTDTSEISSPSIFSRRLQTSLSLADGQSMLLGGLMSSNRSDGKTKVPLLGDIPLIGAAFQNRRRAGTRTELLMLITPYVVEDAQQAREITDAIRSRFGNSKP
ncbi:MAG: type II secretion system protein GspD [Pseudomonadota bacterium]